MAKRKRRKAGKKNGQQRLPGWLYMFFGLAIGLAVAAGIYVNDRREGALIAPIAPAKPSATPQSASPAKSDSADTPKDDSIEFDFYDMLPNLDVEIFEDGSAPRPQARPKPRVITPGIYILQAGSFTRLSDAQRREGEIALLGVRAEVKKGDANGRSVYRVYTQPLETPETVNRVRDLLNENGIETLAKRVSD